MPTMGNSVLDAALNEIKTATRMDLCVAEPTTYAAITAAGNSLGNKTGLTGGSFAANSDNAGAGGGRKTTLNTFTGGTISASGNANFWALSRVADSTLLATGVLTNDPVAVVTGPAWNLNAGIDIIMPDPA